MRHSYLSPERRVRALSVGLAATTVLYALVVFVAEPLKSLAATTADTIVQFTVTSALSVTCSATSTLGSAAGNGTVAGSGSLATAYCQPVTNNGLGYSLSWIILSGSGVSPSVNSGCTPALPCYGTGHLLSNNVTSGYPDVIKSMRVRTSGDTYWDTRVRQLNDTTVTSGSGSRWGARLRAISSTPGGGSITWGSDGASEGFVHVNTGSSVTIAKRTTETSSTGDLEHFLFKVVIPSGAFQPTGTYKSTIRFTVTDN